MLVLMCDESVFDYLYCVFLMFVCVSVGFLIIVFVFSVFVFWCLRSSGADTFVVFCIVGFIIVCVIFKYVIGFYKSVFVVDLL